MTAKRLLSLYAKDPDPWDISQGKETVPNNYFSKRHLLFSRFDEGIHLTSEMWYSVCAECFARIIAKVLSNHIRGKGCVLDLFGGAGGQAIGFALEGHTVHSMEYIEQHCGLIRHNAKVYGVSHLVFPICGDVFTQGIHFCTSGATLQQYDCVVLSPPWGGPGYWRNGDIDLRTLKMNRYRGSQLISLMCKIVDMRISKRFILHLPRNTTSKSIHSAGARIARHIAKIEEKYAENSTSDLVRSSVTVSEMQLDGRVNFLAVYIGCWDKQIIKGVDCREILFTPLDDHNSRAPCGHLV